MPGYRKPDSNFQSRIPIRAAPQNRSPPALSKLQQLQIEYQDRINREKEQRLQALFDRQQDQQERAYNRIVRNSSAESGTSSIQNRGNVREFFKQRRVQNENDTPPNSGRPPKPPYKRNSAGRDRANPLAPIQKPHNNSYNGYQQNGYDDRSPRKRPTSRERTNSAGSDYGPSKMSPQPPKFKRETQLPKRPNKYKYSSNQFGHGTVDRQEKRSDFQKWQQEQDEAKQKRLENYRKSRRDSGSDLDQSFRRSKPQAKRTTRKPMRHQPSTDDDYNDDSDGDETPTARGRRHSREIERDLIRQKEKELEAMILRQKQELMTMQKKREAEQQRKAEAERRRQRLEEERRRLRRPSLLSAEESDGSPGEGPVVPHPPPVDSARSNRSTPVSHRRHLRHKAPATKRTPRRDPSPESPPPPPKQQTKPPKPVFKPKIVKRRKSSPTPPPPDEQLPPTSGANDYLNILDGEMDAAPQNLNLRPCPVCGRKFAAERLEKHRKACEKSNTKKQRKVFDMTKKRTEGTEAAQYVKNRPKTPEIKLKRRDPRPWRLPPISYNNSVVRKGIAKVRPKEADGASQDNKKKGNWRQKHEDFINCLRYAKKVSAVESAGGNLADLPPPPASQNPDYTECPSCGRRFNQAAAERHIPKCKDIKAKPKALKKRGR